MSLPFGLALALAGIAAVAFLLSLTALALYVHDVVKARLVGTAGAGVDGRVQLDGEGCECDGVGTCLRARSSTATAAEISQSVEPSWGFGR